MRKKKKLERKRERKRRAVCDNSNKVVKREEITNKNRVSYISTIFCKKKEKKVIVNGKIRKSSIIKLYFISTEKR